MFEARILQGSTLKKIIEAIRELVVDANLDCNEGGITMQVRKSHQILYKYWRMLTSRINVLLCTQCVG